MCSTCSRNKEQVLQAPPRVIISQGFLSGVVTSIYILHLMDHFSKFHLLAPLIQKTQAEVNLALSQMFRNRVLGEKIVPMEATYHGDGPAPRHLWLPLYNATFFIALVIQLTV
ncbi:hypothetical protein ACJMK2_032116 [Sinanodonta woodiana]|uniref:Uncharacterized protein n=1 Tax=Sinanodonta woodiana TaxID=1069815 RepID=A0ABD3X1B9_SINWO